MGLLLLRYEFLELLGDFFFEADCVAAGIAPQVVGADDYAEAAFCLASLAVA